MFSFFLFSFHTFQFQAAGCILGEMRLRRHLIARRFETNEPILHIFNVFGNTAPFDRPYYRKFQPTIDQSLRGPILNAVKRIMVIHPDDRPDVHQAVVILSEEFEA